MLVWSNWNPTDCKMLCMFIRRVRSAEDNCVATPCRVLSPFPQIDFNRKIYKAAPCCLSSGGHAHEPIRRAVTASTHVEWARGTGAECSARRTNRCLSLAQRVTEQRQREERSSGHAPNTHTEREDRGRGSRSTPSEVGDWQPTWALSLRKIF